MPTYSLNVRKMTTRKVFDSLLSSVAYTQPYGGTYNQYGQTPVVTRTPLSTSVTIYSGVQPTAQQVESNWTAYNQSSSACLAHYASGPTWQFNDGTKTYYFTNTSNAITTNALRSGTASWAIIWQANNISINSDDIPFEGKFVVVPVTLNNSIGIIRYTDLTATTGQAFIPYDGGLTIVEA